MYEHVRNSVRGGRCYPTFLGIYQKPVYVYDICGMYASALSHPMPYGRTEEPFEAASSIQCFQRLLDSKKRLSYFHKKIKPMIIEADCFPPDVDDLDVLPPLCSRKSGRLCWTNEPLLGEVLTTVDLIILHNRGWKVQLRRDPDMYAVWTEWKPICRNYVSINIAAKEKADKENNQTQRSISKLLSNALYGSFATRLDNKSVVFMEDVEDGTTDLTEGTSEIVSLTTVVSRSLPTIDTSHYHTFFNLPQVHEDEASLQKTNLNSTPFIGDAPGRADGRSPNFFKPITFLSSECDNLMLATVQKNSEWIRNDRYATQIASFVLAWSRAFMSEWAEILYKEDKGKPYDERVVKSLYGDTDSLFLTEEGHKLMQTAGKHRLKSSGNSLVYQDGQGLKWLVECETQCTVCKSDAFASEAVFLAPKLYALKDVTCGKCGHVNNGKLRAKGHAKECVSYDLLKACFIDYYLLEAPTTTYQSERTSMKKTLMNSVGSSKPFTVVEKQLIRILRPWMEKTLTSGPMLEQGYLLYPFDRSNPNPHPQEPLTENPFWDDSSVIV